MGRFPDPHSRLGALLSGTCGGEIVESRQTPWASATFSGARHHYVLRVPHAAWDHAAEPLDEREFDLPGHILADIALGDHVKQPDADCFTISALTVEDA